MRDKVQMGIGMLAGALLLGALGDGLLRVGPWSVNLFLWICALIVTLFGLARWQGVKLEGAGSWLFIPVLLLAAAIVWRDSLTLKVANTLASPTRNTLRADQRMRAAIISALPVG